MMLEEQYWSMTADATAGLKLTPLTITAPVCDEAGVPLEGDERPVGPMELRKGVDIRTVGPGRVDANSRIPLGDCLDYNVKCLRTLSARALAAFAADGVRLEAGTYLWPLRVRNSVTKELRGEYTVLWPPAEHAVLAGDAEVKYFAGTKAINKVLRWRLDPGRLPNADLFLTDSLVWLATSRVRDCVQARGLTGFKFWSLLEGSPWKF